MEILSRAWRAYLHIVVAIMRPTEGCNLVQEDCMTASGAMTMRLRLTEVEMWSIRAPTRSRTASRPASPAQYVSSACISFSCECS